MLESSQNRRQPFISDTSKTNNSSNIIQYAEVCQGKGRLKISTYSRYMGLYVTKTRTSVRVEIQKPTLQKQTELRHEWYRLFLVIPSQSPVSAIRLGK
jgi:hypothetical protein